MSAQVLDTEQEIVTIEVRGKLTPEELAVVHAETAVWLSRWGGGSLLILADEFDGWDEGQSWENLSFQTRNDPLIRKMALVADQRWESLALMFTAKGHRPFPIECFTSQIAARTWLCG